MFYCNKNAKILVTGTGIVDVAQFSGWRQPTSILSRYEKSHKQQKYGSRYIATDRTARACLRCFVFYDDAAASCCCCQLSLFLPGGRSQESDIRLCLIASRELLYF